MAGVLAGGSIAKTMIIRKIKKLKATSEESAKKPEELGVHKSYLDKLVKLGRIKRTEDNRYYVECKDRKHC
jgi:hypothetical protein